MRREALTRRDFLSWSGRAAVAAAGLTFITYDDLDDPGSSGGRIHKCLSLGGPGPLREDGHPDDYRLWGNREFIRDLSGTTWVKLWVSWHDLQQELGGPPASREASWHHLDTAPDGESWLRRLDRQLRAAGEDGVRVVLGLDHRYPTWASGATGPSPAEPAKPAERKLPLDVSPNGPWAWFIAYLISRYRRGSPANHDGASIDALEICNEPNYLGWPQEGIAEVVAQMVRTATALSAVWGGTPILAPATSDFPDATRRGPAGIKDTVWSEFTVSVLDLLRGYRSPVPLRWSHHNYRDVRLGDNRAERVLRMLRGAGWVSDVAPLWLTEGGLDLGTRAGDTRERAEQAVAIERSFRQAMRLPGVYLFTQHTISDKPGNDFKSGLRDDFIAGSGPGARRPSWFAWRDLPGAQEP